MNLKHKLTIAAIVLGCVLILALLTLPWGARPQSNDWLHLTGPEFIDRTNAQGGVSSIASLTFSNSGPRQLMFSVVELRWVAGDARGNCLGPLGGFVHLASGVSTNLIFPMTMTPPRDTHLAPYWHVQWQEEWTGVRRFFGSLQQQRSRLSFRWPPPQAGGLIEPPQTEGDKEAYFRAKYGLTGTNHLSPGTNVPP